VDPLADLVAPRVAVLRPAQRLGLARRIEPGDRAVLPGQLAQARLEHRGERARRGGEHPAVAFDHHVAHFGQARADQRDPRAAVLAGDVAHPFGARAGLAEAAPGADQPGPPALVRGLARRELLVARPAFPVIAAERGELVRLELPGERLARGVAFGSRAAQPLAAGGRAPAPSSGCHRSSPPALSRPAPWLAAPCGSPRRSRARAPAARRSWR